MSSEYTEILLKSNKLIVTPSENSLAKYLQPQNAAAAQNCLRIPISNYGHEMSGTTANPIGPDTVNLTVSTTYCEIAPHFRAALSTSANSDGTYDNEPFILWTDIAGRHVFGNKATINTDNYQLTIVPCGGHANLLLNFSAKAFAANNVDVMDAERLRNVIQSIQNELLERGLKCDLFREAHVRRLDVARNADLQHTTNAYVGLFRNYPARVGAVLRPASDGDTYFRLGANDWQTVIYDKGQEQAEKSATRKRRLPATKQMRGEIRFMKSREVAKRFEVKKLHPHELLKPERFAQLPEMYRETMRASMFETECAPRAVIQMDENTVKIWAQVQNIIAQVEPHGTRRHERLCCYAMTFCADGLDGARAWFAETRELDDSESAKRARRRFETDIQLIVHLFGAVATESTGYARDELYTEMRDALLCD